MKTNDLKKYIISSYILVWALIIFVAGTASLVFHAPPVIMWIVRNLIAWSPTYLLFIGWKHFRILSLLIFSIIMKKPMMSYINLGTTILPLSIFLSFTSGPTGEELGRRGYMREEFNKKYGFLKSAVCQGLVWCFWHTLLWVVDSEFTDWRAIPYVVSNIVVITSITMLMNIFLERHNGIGHAEKNKRISKKNPVPYKYSILTVHTDAGYTHWTLFYDNKYYDPEFGLIEGEYTYGKITSFLEIYVEG